MIELLIERENIVVKDILNRQHLVYGNHDGVKVLAKSEGLSNHNVVKYIKLLTPQGSHRTERSWIPEVKIIRIDKVQHAVVFQWILPDEVKDMVGRTGGIYTHVIITEAYRRSNILREQLKESVYLLSLLYFSTTLDFRNVNDMNIKILKIRNAFISLRDSFDSECLSIVTSQFEYAVDKLSKMDDTKFNKKVLDINFDIKKEDSIQCNNNDLIIDGIADIYTSTLYNPNLNMVKCNSLYTEPKSISIEYADDEGGGIFMSKENSGNIFLRFKRFIFNRKQRKTTTNNVYSA